MNIQYYSPASLNDTSTFAGRNCSNLGPGYVGDSMGSEEGEWEEDGEDSDKKEHLTCVPEQEATPGIDHAIEQL